MNDDFIFACIKATIAGFFVGFAVLLVMLIMALAYDSRQADDAATTGAPTEERTIR